jgi:hypothetical protein
MNYESGGMAFLGSILTGVGVGLWVGEVKAATVTGLGIGFVLMALLRRRS